MKKLNKKLQLNKESIARLNDDQQSSVYGGYAATGYSPCYNDSWTDLQTISCNCDKGKITVMSERPVCVTLSKRYTDCMCF